MTEEQKEFLKELMETLRVKGYSSTATDIRKLFPEAFEPGRKSISLTVEFEDNTDLHAITFPRIKNVIENNFGSRIKAVTEIQQEYEKKFNKEDMIEFATFIKRQTGIVTKKQSLINFLNLKQK